MNSKVNLVEGCCLCGEVRFQASIENYEITACHCSMCCCWSSGIFLSLDAKDSLVITKDHALKIFKSSLRGKRGFCQNCGSSLFWQCSSGKQTYINYAALALPKKAHQQLMLTTEIYVDSQPDFYRFENKTKRLTGNEVVALSEQTHN